jgi:hypothetical protein
MSYEVPIERGKVMEFARATKSTNVAYLQDVPVIPPTFLTTARLVWEPVEQNPLAELGLDMRRLLHGEEEFVFHGPLPRAGQALRVEARLDDQWERQGKRGGRMRFVRVINEFRDASGRLVAEQSTTVIETSRAPEERA